MICLICLVMLVIIDVGHDLESMSKFVSKVPGSWVLSPIIWYWFLLCYYRVLGDVSTAT
jgi:hypothetical protein